MAKDAPAADGTEVPEQTDATAKWPDDAWSGEGESRRIKRDWVAAQSDRRSRLALALKGTKRG